MQCGMLLVATAKSKSVCKPPHFEGVLFAMADSCMWCMCFVFCVWFSFGMAVHSGVRDSPHNPVPLHGFAQLVPLLGVHFGVGVGLGIRWSALGHHRHQHRDCDWPDVAGASADCEWFEAHLGVVLLTFVLLFFCFFFRCCCCSNFTVASVQRALAVTSV